MNCDFCDQKATVFLTQLIDGQMKKVCLCESCAKTTGVTDPTGFSLPSNPTFSSKNRISSGKKCPTCGFGADDLNRVRRFGCSDCFQAFRPEIDLILRGMHQGITHVGKVPKGFEEIHARDEKLEELRAKLELAVQQEHYEEAATLVEQIRQLEQPSPSAP